MPSFKLWLDNRPDVFKGYRAQLQHTRGPIWTTSLAMVHLYALQGFLEGTLYEMQGCQGRGITKAQMLEVLAIAFLHGGPRVMHYASVSTADFLRTYEDKQPAPELPEGWGPDPDAFRSGIDLTTEEMPDREIRMLKDWYTKTIGEVPTSVTFLAEHNPGLLKAYRRRWETAIHDLPKQVMPVYMMQWNVVRGFREGIREGALLGKAFGMTKDQVISAASWHVGYHGGLDAITNVDVALKDVLKDWK